MTFNQIIALRKIKASTIALIIGLIQKTNSTPLWEKREGLYEYQVLENVVGYKVFFKELVKSIQLLVLSQNIKIFPYIYKVFSCDTSYNWAVNDTYGKGDCYQKL